jgi:hypothetical protein
MFALPTTGCLTAAMMEQESLTAGQPVAYAADPDTVVTAARLALSDRGLDLHGVSRPDTTTRLVLGAKPAGPFTYGAWMRLAISAGDSGATALRVVSRSRSLLDLFHQDASPTLLQALDARLAPTAVLVPRTHVRLVVSGHAIEGELTDVRDDALIVRDPTAAETAVPLGDLARASVLRGRLSNAKEMMLVGSVIGGFAGLLIANANTRPNELFAGLERLSGTMAGSLVGAVAGGIIGSRIKTAIWSDLDVRRLRSR